MLVEPDAGGSVKLPAFITVALIAICVVAAVGIAQSLRASNAQTLWRDKGLQILGAHNLLGNATTQWDEARARIDLRRALAPIAQQLDPRLSTYRSCGMPWSFVEGHSTHYSDGSGMFPLCTQCFDALHPTERLPFYRALFDEWHAHGSDARWEDIERAVLEGR